MPTDIPLARGDITRDVAKEPYIAMWNRFAEENPALNDNQVSLIARPAMRKFCEVGAGHIRKLFTEVGLFGNDLFVVSGTVLYRVSSAAVVTEIGSLGSDILGDVSMCAVAQYFDIPAYLYIADGGILWCYTENGHSMGHLEATGAIANGDTVRIGSVYYLWTNASVDASSPAGTVGNPWRVALGSSNAEALDNLAAAIDENGTAGTTYSTALTAHALVKASAWSANDLYVLARAAGVDGDAIATTDTGANIAWDAATLEDGGDPQLRQVQVPDDAGAISVASLNRYVAVVPVQSTGKEGVFYWIRPGANTIDALDFATAERSPDKIHQALVSGELLWLCGEKTKEPWYTTGTGDNAFARYQGILEPHGSWEGTALDIEGGLLSVDENGAVWLGGNLISTPAIAERIRRAMDMSELYP